ncbi:MAG: hypothetical protein JXR65_10270 [Bacteroidales bacterium]|nr:hypothetical protein [Bacteroidales bacterium]
MKTRAFTLVKFQSGLFSDSRKSRRNTLVFNPVSNIQWMNKAAISF